VGAAVRTAVQPADHAVTVLISRQVRPGCERQFEAVAQQLLHVATRAPGYLGAQLMHPGEEPGVHDSLYHVVLAFDTQAHLDAWQQSPERAQGLAAAKPMLEGPATLRSMAGLALWFRGPAVATPPRWKIAVVTWLGICPTVYLMFLLLWDWVAGWWLLPRVMLLTMLVVAVMTWIVAPQLTRLFRSWLSPSALPSLSPSPSRPPDAARTA
jgi:antibiotic biosynthesis monooxygenase (ABM) superfamily enzyme